MSKENTQNVMNESETSAEPPVLHANGTSNGATGDANAAGTSTSSTSPKRKKKTRRQQQRDTPQNSSTIAAPTQEQTVPEVAAAPAAPEEPITGLTEGSAEEITEEPTGLRLRAKVWTDGATGKRYLMPTAFFRDIVDGRPVSDVMRAYAMRDDDTKLITLRVAEWNALPFFYFEEDGPAPRASARPVDVIEAETSTP